jgi:hypothetical protein
VTDEIAQPGMVRSPGTVSSAGQELTVPTGLPGSCAESSYTPVVRREATAPRNRSASPASSAAPWNPRFTARCQAANTTSSEVSTSSMRNPERRRASAEGACRGAEE